MPFKFRLIGNFEICCIFLVDQPRLEVMHDQEPGHGIGDPLSLKAPIKHNRISATKCYGFCVAFSWMVNQLSPCGSCWSTQASSYARPGTGKPWSGSPTGAWTSPKTRAMPNAHWARVVLKTQRKTINFCVMVDTDIDKP